jgi:hypothetical protein
LRSGWSAPVTVWRVVGWTAVTVVVTVAVVVVFAAVAVAFHQPLG